MICNRHHRLVSSPRFAAKTTSLVLDNTISTYLQPTSRRSLFTEVNPKNLASLLDKLIKFGSGSRVPAEREAAERRKRDYDAVVRLT